MVVEGRGPFSMSQDGLSHKAVGNRGGSAASDTMCRTHKFACESHVYFIHEYLI
jgi:hypothetical protein